MKQSLKNKLNKWAIFIYTIIANVVFIGSTVYMIACGDYSLLSIIAFGVVAVGITLVWDIAVAISFSKKCSDLYDRIKEWVKRL